MKKKPRRSFPLIYVCAGEASGDFLGGHLMRALKKCFPEVSFMGIGGPRMIQEGLNSLVPMEKLSHLGLVEILPKLFGLRKLIHKTVAHIQEYQPDLLVTIDSPGFNFRVGKKLKKNLKKQGTIPHVHYGAPTVWAWRPKRARSCARFLDHMLTLFPFEPPFFEKEGLPTTFVGHPLLEESQKRKSMGKALREVNKKQKIPQVCLLPGSRVSEVKRLLPLFLEALDLLYEAKGPFQVKLPTFSSLTPLIERILSQRSHAFGIKVVQGLEAKKRAFQESTIALAASGTVALELAYFGLPCVIGYRVNTCSAWALKRMLRVPFVTMPNILLGRRVVAEVLQERCTPQVLCAELKKLLECPAECDHQKEAFLEVVRLLQPAKGKPSELAAQVLQKILIQEDGGKK